MSNVANACFALGAQQEQANYAGAERCCLFPVAVDFAFGVRGVEQLVCQVRTGFAEEGLVDLLDGGILVGLPDGVALVQEKNPSVVLYVHTRLDSSKETTRNCTVLY